MSSREAFDLLEIGATRAQAEALLGAPVLGGDGPNDDAWFLPPPEIGVADSPWGPGAVLLRFKSGRVIAKELNPQVKRR